MTHDDDDKLVPIGVSFNSFQAEIIKTKLEANDIHCFLFDQQSFNAMSHLSLAIGGIRIMVLKSDLEAAKNIIAEAHTDIEISKD